MHPTINRLKEWGHAALNKLKQRDWRLWLLVVVVGYALLEAIRAQISDTTSLVVVWLVRALLWVLKQPMGFGGAVLIGSVMVLILSSWWQTRPKPPVQEVERQPLSDLDRRLVQDIRTIWNRHGVVAVSQARDLLRDTTWVVKQTEYWGGLLDPIVNELSSEIDAMNETISSRSFASIGEVRNRFNQVYSQYLKALRWIARLDHHGTVALDGEFARRLQWWKENHFRFFEKLQDLHEVPEHSQSLHIYQQFFGDDPPYEALIWSAETLQNSLLLRTQPADPPVDSHKLAAG